MHRLERVQYCLRMLRFHLPIQLDHDDFITVVICGKYKNLNKITYLTSLPEISQTSYFCYSLQFTMENIGTCCLKKGLNTETSNGNCVLENLKK